MFNKYKAYLWTFLLSFLITNGIMGYFFINELDFIKTSLFPIAKNPLDDAIKLDSLIVKKNIPEPVVQYGNYLKLKEIINNTFNEKLPTLPSTEIDSTKSKLLAKIDTLSFNHQEFIKKINDLYRENLSKQDSIAQLQEKITALENNIIALKQEKEQKPDTAKQQSQEKGIKYLADTYNTMNTQKVAQILSAAPEDEVVQILQKMNQRKVGKVLEAMPKSKANSLVGKLVGRG